MNLLAKLEAHIGVWLVIFLSSLIALGGALYYQYGLGWDPCVLCVHIRIIMLGILILATAMLFLYRFQLARLIAFTGLSTLCIWLFMKSKTLYRVEKGLEDSSCWFSADLPSWFDLEKWFPSIFEVRAACGDSPIMFLDITMADTLYAASWVAMPLSVIFTLLSFYFVITRQKH